MYKHLLTGEEFSFSQTTQLLNLAQKLKQDRSLYKTELSGFHLALIFEKPSLRTRFSFTVAMRELGGDVVESQAQSSKFEEPEDTARVLGGYCQGIMLRTHDDVNLQKMAKYSPVPIINGLSANHHPCQIFADLMTLHETFGYLEGLKLSYIGDANNILHSLLLIAPKLGLEVHYATPMGRKPSDEILERCDKTRIFSHQTAQSAVEKAHAVYTDVWTSMGFESESDEAVFEGYQVTEELMDHAKSNAIFMHCMPMCRGKEISETLPEDPRSAIFQQSENRLHIQKAILIHLLKGRSYNET
jgi:carbamoyl-phosphate synthase large subunit